jgi:hypothetical protein
MTEQKPKKSCVFSCFCSSGCLMLWYRRAIFSKKNLQRFCKGFLCLLAGSVVGSCNRSPSDDFSKTMQRAPFKKTNLNQQQKRSCCCCCNPFPPLVAAIKAEKQLTPQHQRQHREKRRATGPKPRKNPDTKIFAPPSKYTQKVRTQRFARGAIGFV